MNFSKRQIEIINASKDIIGKKGIQNLTIKNLAKKMSFSEPALYRHFKNKTDILKTLLLFHEETINKKIIEIKRSNKTAIQKIKLIIDFQFNHLQKDPSVVMIVFSETSFQYNDILFSVVVKAMEQRTKNLIDIIEEGEEAGEIRNDTSAQRIASIILGGMRFTILKWRFNNFKPNLNKEGSELWKTIKKLITK